MAGPKWLTFFEETMGTPQGYNARKVISEVYASFVLQCMKYSGHRKLLCDKSKLSKFNAFNLLGY